MKATQATMYQCPNCFELHISEWKAEECCTPEPQEVTVWACGECGTTYDDENHARECCWDGETDLEPYIPTPAELEHFGQLRLSL